MKNFKNFKLKLTTIIILTIYNSKKKKKYAKIINNLFYIK